MRESAGGVGRDVQLRRGERECSDDTGGGEEAAEGFGYGNGVCGFDTVEGCEGGGRGGGGGGGGGVS